MTITRNEEIYINERHFMMAAENLCDNASVGDFSADDIILEVLNAVFDNNEIMVDEWIDQITYAQEKEIVTTMKRYYTEYILKLINTSWENLEHYNKY